MPKVINKNVLQGGYYDDYYISGKALVADVVFKNCFRKTNRKEVVLVEVSDDHLIRLELTKPKEIEDYLRKKFFSNREESKKRRFFYKRNRKNG